MDQVALVSRLEWCAGKRELGEEEGEVGAFRWYDETTVILPDLLLRFDWMRGFRSGVEADGPSDH